MKYMINNFLQLTFPIVDLHWFFCWSNTKYTRLSKIIITVGENLQKQNALLIG